MDSGPLPDNLCKKVNIIFGAIATLSFVFGSAKEAKKWMNS